MFHIPVPSHSPCTNDSFCSSFYLLHNNHLHLFLFFSSPHVPWSDAPRCKANQKVIFGVATREPIQVPCQVEADPIQVTFRWALNNTMEVLPIKNHVSAQLTSIANYSPRTKFGYGELLCWAKNGVGEQKEPCVYQVVAAGQPEPVQNCLVGNQSTDSLIVKCESGQDGGLEQVFHLEIYQSGRSGQLQANLSSSRSPVFDVQGLPLSTQFVLVLYAANGKGRSHSVALTTSTLPLPNKGELSSFPLFSLLMSGRNSLYGSSCRNTRQSWYFSFYGHF